MNLLFVLILLLSSWQAIPENQNIDWETVVNNSTSIITVRAGSDVASHYELMPAVHWKGKYSYDYSMPVSAVSFNLVKGENYLIFILGDGPHLQLATQPIHSKEIPVELQTILDKLPCFLETETAVYRKKTNPNFTGACHRIYNPVCGCDGVTYGNDCEAHLQGIVKYSLGRCKESR